jgi:UDP-glucose 6-dehydrogenase
MIFGLVGLGVVGLATKQMLEAAGHKDFKIYDPRIKESEKDLRGCDATFVSVPVPTLPSGEQDLSTLEDAIAMCYGKVFIRSTILPGTTLKLQEYFTDLELFHLPEFLTEKTAKHDALSLDLVCSKEASHYLREYLPNRALRVVELEIECEFVKYMHNAFCAVKVGFFNTMNQYAKKNGLNYQEAVDAACGVTGFIERTHTQVPGPDGKLGFGGKCLPKDLFAFANFLETSLGQPNFLRDVLNENFYNRFEG